MARSSVVLFIAVDHFGVCALLCVALSSLCGSIAVRYMCMRCCFLAIVLRAAMRGERSFRGMWLWARVRRDDLRPHMGLGVRAVRWIPRMATSKCAVCMTTVGERERAQPSPLLAERDLTLDGTWLRWSTWVTTDALETPLAGVTMGLLSAQRAVSDGDEWAAALVLLEAFPLDEKVINADAGQKLDSGCTDAGIACRRSHATDGSRAGRYPERPARDLAPDLKPAFALLSASWCDWIERTRWRAGWGRGGNARLRLDCRRDVSLVGACRRDARPVAAPLDDGKPGLPGA